MALPRSARLSYLTLQADHAAAVLHLFNTDPAFIWISSGATKSRYTPEEIQEWITDIIDERFAPGLPAERQAWLVLQSDGELTGIAEMGLVHPGESIPWIGLIQIRADLRHHGFGREVVTTLEAAAAARGYRQLGLSVLVTNTGGLAFWPALGYSSVGERGEGPMRSVIFRKDLAPPPPAARADTFGAPPGPVTG
jgi:GNAT superfamily N-acetyltransferase